MRVLCATCNGSFHVATSRDVMPDPNTGIVILDSVDRTLIVMCQSCLDEFKKDFGLDFERKGDFLNAQPQRIASQARSRH